MSDFYIKKIEIKNFRNFILFNDIFWKNYIYCNNFFVFFSFNF